MSANESLGDVDSPVGVLRCTLGAFENITVKLGSFGDAFHRVEKMDAFAAALIVSEAVPMSLDAAKVAIWRAGLTKLTVPQKDEKLGVLQKYLAMLSNGGKMPETEQPDAKKPAPGEA